MGSWSGQLPTTKKARDDERHWLCLSRNVNESFGRFLPVAEANRSEVAPGTPHARSFIELGGTDVPGNVAHLGQVLGELIAVPAGGVPLDLGLLGLDQNAERKFFSIRLGQLVGRQLIRQFGLEAIVAGTGGLEVNHRLPATPLRNEINHADEE